MSESVPLNKNRLEVFVSQVLYEGGRHYRDFAWRMTRDPYAILLSEVMLQQTQVVRVVDYFERWLLRYPSIDALAAASTADVLADWQGLGYNRRALALKRLAVEVSEQQAGILPASYEGLQLLPGVGPATAAGVMAFAYNEFAPYLETNVRSVVLHELFAGQDEVCDKEVMAVVQQAAEHLCSTQLADARTWNYALLDYGAWLKKAFPNPSRRSKQHTKQSRFEGSFRQKRAQLLRAILMEPQQTRDELAGVCELSLADTEAGLGVLFKEGFIQCDNGRYSINE
ncbi:MAG: adenine glycosylase [Coriobacteriia bacterium]|nr:adenine glycosylase [Coriobacteriia bacterium]